MGRKWLDNYEHQENYIINNQNNNLIPIAENGKIIKDNNGYWNPDSWGKLLK